jgi:copper chaperone CopZ
MQTLKTFLFIAMAVIATSFAHAQSFNYKLDGPFKSSKTFKVQGTCEMCKQRIEGSIKNLPGVWSSYWDISTKTLQVTYDRSKLNPAEIEKRVSGQGHDINSVMASADVYNKLPDCCHYPRKS